MIAIIDYDAGNIKSVEKALHYLGEETVVSRDPQVLLSADKVIPEETYVYFVHSYYLQAKEPEIVKATAQYGVTIHASVEKDNIFACQFHPEKSSKYGLKILENFAKLGKEA